jgi:uncharacterized membrane protein YhaH (DUF805 family)
MEFIEAVKSVFSKYATFQGRACRSEYWWFGLFCMIVGFGLMVISRAVLGGTGVLNMLFTLAIFLPSTAVLVRRLHDIDKSGWWYFIIFIPVIGLILYLFWMCKKGTSGPNRFGGDPLGHQIVLETGEESPTITP